MSPTTRVAVVTGANRGIGKAIIDRLVATGGQDYGLSGKLVLYAASRSGDTPPTPAAASPSVELRGARLSLTDPRSIDDLVAAIKAEHGGCHMLVNNAGIYYYRENITAAQRKETLDVNYRGTLKVCQAFIPIMHDGGRIVNLSSQSGQLHYFAPHLRTRFLDPDLTLNQLDQLVGEYSDAAAKGDAVQRGWPRMTYFTSKAALNAATRILARDNPRLLINCCCPGWVNTELGGQAGAAPKTPAEGARIPLKLALGDIGGISGRYWANDSVSEKGDGKVQPW
ncbi:NAD(P)-binding protein [Westerdykella ornata]|uniref:NAD(P)-binding protein n=1 Tax=Westerdykella ornata TaxID=318751 RepID=A0A6A6JU82_WESOR|nr:NAD(P)-binding protein [Westerdykella ornata]KAF2280132.1 NAD(P)-binding protein [Westerdykella ornata]